MPNRVLRDFTLSERVDKLCPKSENLYIRMMTQFDDYGRFPMNVRLIKSRCVPLKDWTDKEVEGYINQMKEAGLINIYEVEGKKYVEIVDFGQNLRRMKATFPENPKKQAKNEAADICRTTDGQVTDNCRTSDGHCPAETKRNETETETNPKRNDNETKGSSPSIEKNPEGFIPEKKEPVKELGDRLGLDLFWLENAAKSSSVEVSDVKKLIPQFVAHLNTEKIKEKTERDFIQHFMNWSRKKLNQQNHGKNHRNSKNIGNHAAGFGSL